MRLMCGAPGSLCGKRCYRSAPLRKLVLNPGKILRSDNRANGYRFFVCGMDSFKLNALRHRFIYLQTMLNASKAEAANSLPIAFKD